MADQSPYEAARARAYVLADTGRFAGWDDLSAGLLAEGQDDALVRRMGRDGFLQIMLKNRISAARGA